MPSLRRFYLKRPRRDGCGGEADGGSTARRDSNVFPPSSSFRRHRSNQEGRVVRFSASLCPPRSTRRGGVLDQPLFSRCRSFDSSLGWKAGSSLRWRSLVSSPFVYSSQDYTSASASSSKDFPEGTCTTSATSSFLHPLASNHFFCRSMQAQSHRVPLKKQIKYHSPCSPLLYIPGVSRSPCSSPSPHISCSCSPPNTISASCPTYLRPLLTPPTSHLFPQSSLCLSRSSFFSSFAFSEWRTEPILRLRGVGKVSRPVIVLPTSSSSSSSSAGAPSSSHCKSNRRFIPSQKGLIYPVQEKEHQGENSDYPCLYDVSSDPSETPACRASRRAQLSGRQEEESSLSSRLSKKDLHDKNSTAVSGDSPPSSYLISHSRHDGERKRRDEGGFFVSSGLYSEKEIGAGAFVSEPPCKGWMLDGIMRYRSEDFIVREVDEDGRLSTVFPKREANEGSSEESLFKGLEEIDRRRERLMKALENCRNEIQRRNTTLAHPSDHTTVPCCSCSLPSSCSSSSSASREVSEHSDDLMKITLEALAKEAEAISSIKFVLVKLNKETPEALEVLAKATGIDVSRFSFAGMKDRRSITTQWISCSNPLILPADSSTTTATSSAVSSFPLFLPSGQEFRAVKGFEKSSPAGSASHEKATQRGSEEEEKPREEQEEQELKQMSNSTEATNDKTFYRSAELEERHTGDQSRMSLQTERESSVSASSRLMAGSRKISSSVALPSFIPSSFSSAKDEETTTSHHVLLSEPSASSSRSREPLTACPHHGSHTSSALSACLHPGYPTTFLPGEQDADLVNSCARKEEEAAVFNGEKAGGPSSKSITQEKEGMGSPPSPVLLTAEVAREATLHPSWDSSGIHWGNFEVGKVYLGCLGGNHFSILLRNLQMTSLADSSKARCAEHTIPVSENAAFSSSSSLSVSSVFSSPVDSAYQQGRLPEERSQGSPNEKEEREKDVLINFVKEAAVSITRRGFVNYFGPQRFGTGRRPSYHIGRALLHRQYRKVCNLIMMQPPLPPSFLPSSLDQKLRDSSERGDISKSVDQEKRCSSHGQQHEEEPKRKRDEGPPGRKEDIGKAEIDRDERHEEKREVKKSRKSSNSVTMMAEEGEEQQRHQGERAEEIPYEDSWRHSCLLDSARKKNHSAPSSPPPGRLPFLITQEKKSQDIYRRYLSAQEAFWQGDFYRAFACLPRQCRQERQLLRSLLSSPSLSHTSAFSNGGLRCHQNSGEGGEHTSEGRDRQYLLDDDDADTEECLEALELAHASGGTGPSGRVPEHSETVSSSYSPLPSSSSFAPWKDHNTTDLRKDKVPLGYPLSTPSLSADPSCSVVGSFPRSCDTEIKDRDTDADDGKEGCERKRGRGIGGARFARKEDVIKAVKSIPKLQRVLFVKAYSAYIWNRCATERIRLYGADAPVPGDLVLCHEGDEGGKRLFTHGATPKEKNKESSSSFSASSHSPSRNGDLPSSPLTESSCEETTKRRKGKDPVVRVLKTKEECAKYSITDVVLPLIGVGMQLPENQVGDFLARLIQEEGLHERLYRREEDIFLDASYRPLLSLPRNFSCELLVARRSLPQSSSSSPSMLKEEAEEERKKKERECKTASPCSASIETGSDATYPCRGYTHRKISDEDQTSLMKVPDGEDEREKYHTEANRRKGEEQERKKIKDDEEGRRREDSAAIDPRRTTSSSSSGSNSRRSIREKTTNTLGRRSEVETRRHAQKLEKDEEETEESWEVIWSSSRTRSKTSEKEENTPENELSSSSFPSSPLSPSSPSFPCSSFALRLHFTLPPGVFASSLIREFTHSPFKHPFEQRLRENRGLPSTNRKKTRENLLSVLFSASSSSCSP